MPRIQNVKVVLRSIRQAQMKDFLQDKLSSDIQKYQDHKISKHNEELI